jgi:hypothetical protein
MIGALGWLGVDFKLLYGEHKRIVELAAKSWLPAMYIAREFVEDWGPDVLRSKLA